MTPFAFSIPGKPQPQERPIVRRAGWTVDPPKSFKAKKVVKSYALVCRQEALACVSSGSFSVMAKFYGANPLCDIDNLLKLVLDGLKGVFWVDDRQVTQIGALKFKCEKGSERTEVWIEEITHTKTKEKA
jgi:Holliday junction resolvase RusA-like endonuclease